MPIVGVHPNSNPVTRTVRRIWRHPANRGRRAQRLVLWVTWQLWERIMRRPWTITMPPGVRLELHPHDPVTSAVLYCRLPDWPEMPFVLAYLRRGEVVVDVGANVGLYSLLAASIPGVDVVAFEPAAPARTTALANVARNGFGGRVDIRPLAVGAASGVGRLTAGLGPLNRLLADDEATLSVPGARQVDVVRLDDAVAGPVAMVKVDIEGGELAVIEGATALLTEWRPVLILEANDPAALTGRLARLGYQWLTYDPDTRHVGAADPPASGANGIAAFDLDAVAARVARPERA